LKSTTLLNQAQIDIYNKNYEKAILRTSESLGILESTKGYYRRGIAYQHINDFEKALSNFKKVKELDPQFSEIDKLIQTLKH